MVLYLHGYYDRLGLHNGHTVIGNEWHSYSLEEDEDENILIAIQTEIEINGYVPHELMGLVVLLEYEIGVPSAAGSLDTLTLLNSTSKAKVRQTTRLAVGSALFIPFDGDEMILRNVPVKDEDTLGSNESTYSIVCCSILKKL